MRKEQREEVMKVENVLGSIDHGHMLVENKGRKDINFHLCLYLKKKRRTIYGCVQCKKGFHVNCFTAYHCTGALPVQTKALMTMVLRTEGCEPRAKNKKSKHVGNIHTMKLKD